MEIKIATCFFLENGLAVSEHMYIPRMVKHIFSVRCHRMNAYIHQNACKNVLRSMFITATDMIQTKGLAT